jgi:hypothetical protein
MIQYVHKVSYPIARKRTAMKTIIAIFETIGKRRKLIGFDAAFNGETIGRYDTARDAEKALDAWAYADAQLVAA